MLHVSIWQISAGFSIASVKWYWHKYCKKVEASLQQKSSQYVSICHWAWKFSTDIFCLWLFWVSSYAVVNRNCAIIVFFNCELHAKPCACEHLLWICLNRGLSTCTDIVTSALWLTHRLSKVSKVNILDSVISRKPILIGFINWVSQGFVLQSWTTQIEMHSPCSSPCIISVSSQELDFSLPPWQHLWNPWSSITLSK